MVIQLEIDKLVGNLWEEMKVKPVEDLHKEVVDWVISPRNMVDHTYSYDHMLMVYSVNMQLVGHSFVAWENKMEGDEELVFLWHCLR